MLVLPDKIITDNREGRGRAQPEKITLTWRLLFYKGQHGTKAPNVLLKSFNILDNDLINFFAHYEVCMTDVWISRVSFWSAGILSNFFNEKYMKLARERMSQPSALRKLARVGWLLLSPFFHRRACQQAIYRFSLSSLISTLRIQGYDLTLTNSLLTHSYVQFS